MTLMRALARINEGMKGTQLSMAIVLYTSPKLSTTLIGYEYLLYYMAYALLCSNVDANRREKVF